ncbi:Gfo/Idh/MocA family oxidoreductase (plasmid) [Haloterrigena salifodinae]|uniref:Gfo/Idh/MocA family oxidoreductase n=1 Tax=Haloterrigena salifodinae TaxID=2675099 RepID=A0A8T8E8Q3_9EURY|nr:Gfo/Idh/MocA family oxidoreductase [Haloterrigena salifodinae]QRV17882.1 Gfo/Idh/MocA family oxidoreductase [Haloterrigena salifodinae]
MIQIGTGNQGEAWCREFLPPNVEDGTVEVVAAVDVNEAALTNAVEALPLSEAECYTDAETAMAEHGRDADAVALVVPPGARTELVSLAIDHGLEILTEKPIAASMDDAVEIVELVERSDTKLGVTMSHRFRQDVTSLRRRLRSGEDGPVDYLYCRYAVNARSRGSWAGERLYDIEEQPLLVDGAIHHLDLLADLAGGRAETVFCRSWNPEYSDFAGDPNAIVQLGMDNGTTIVYEGLNTAATSFNGWWAERIRANCRDASLVLDDGELRRFPYERSAENCLGHISLEAGEPITLESGKKWGNALLVERFAEWCAGGEPMETNARANLRSMAIVFAAIESAETGEAVEVREFLSEQIDSDSPLAERR